MNKIEEEPFVVAARGRFVNELGQHRAIPLGIVLATCTEDAWEQALQRWSEYRILEPCPWGALPADIRLAALKADRGEDPFYKRRL